MFNKDRPNIASETSNGETGQQWWERTKREIRCHEVEQILASDEAFAEAMREIDPSLVKPLTSDEVDRLVLLVAG